MNAIGEKLRYNQGVLGFGSRLVVRWPRLRNVLDLCLYEVLFCFAYRYGMSFSHACASPFWFPDLVLLCALLLNPPRRWWWFVLAPLPIRFLVAVPPDVPLWFLWTTYLIDSAKGILTAAVLRRFLRNPARLETVREFAMYCLFAVLLIPAASALAGAAARRSLGHEYWPAWEQWFMGNALTQLVVTPAILYWVFGLSRRQELPSRKECLEVGLVAAGLILTGYIAFNTESVRIGLSETRFYAPVPFLFWAAIRFGMFGASGGTIIVACFAVQAALSGRGLFAGQSPADTALALQNFLLLRAAPLYLVAILIEQKTGVERSLRESEARFRHMADTAPVMIWMSGPDKLCNFFNKGWLDFTGRTPEHELGDGWAAGVHPDDLEGCLNSYVESFDSRRAFTIEYRLRRHDGEYRWISDYGVPRYDSRENFLGYIGYCIDSTERNQTATDVQRQRVELAHASRVSTMGQLASALAHELSQPLGAILRNAEAGELILRHQPPDYEEVRAILADIRQDDRRAGSVIDRMRSLLQRRDLKFEPLPVNQLLDQVAVLVRAEMSARRVTLQLDLPPDLPLVQGDRVHLQQVVLNLLVNGADAMNDSSIARRLVVQARPSTNGTVEVAVRDSGHGISAEKLPHIFEPFFTTKSNGMGMGLAISKTIVEAHGGRIWAENNAEGGATFRFTLEIAEPGGVA